MVFNDDDDDYDDVDDDDDVDNDDDVTSLTSQN